MCERIVQKAKDITSFSDYFELNKKYPSDHYQKLASILLLRAADLPVLPGYVVMKLDKTVIEFLTDWIKRTGSMRLSFRFDSPLPEDHIRLSSLNPTPEELHKLSPLIIPPVIGIVMAENDRYAQGYSVTTQFLEDRMRLDIVGPGFDAGDITRGKVTPHETIEIVHKTPDCNFDLSQLDILSYRITNSENYERSRKLRYGGIYATINSALGKSVSSQSLGPQETAQVDEFLGKRDASIPNSYAVLGWERLSKIYSYLAMLDIFRDYYKDNFGIEVSGKVLSASFLRKYGLVFWDLFDGKKYTLRK